MSIGTFLKGVLSSITHFIEKLLPSSKHLLDLALEIVNTVKSFDTSHGDILNTLVSLIPGTVDDSVLATIRAKLPTWIGTITYLDLEAGKTADEILAEGIAKLQSLKGVDINAYYDALQTLFKLIGYDITDEAIKYPDLQKISQSYYEEFGK